MVSLVQSLGQCSAGGRRDPENLPTDAGHSELPDGWQGGSGKAAKGTGPGVWRPPARRPWAGGSHSLIYEVPAGSSEVIPEKCLAQCLVHRKCQKPKESPRLSSHSDSRVRVTVQHRPEGVLGPSAEPWRQPAGGSWTSHSPSLSWAPCCTGGWSGGSPDPLQNHDEQHPVGTQEVGAMITTLMGL